MELRQVAHRELRGWLAGTGAPGVFGRYLVEVRPEERTWVAVKDGEVRGVALSGRPFGLFHVYPYWVLADSRAAAARLADNLSELPLNFPVEFAGVFREKFPAARLTFDRIYTLAVEDFSRPAAVVEVRQLAVEDLRGLEIPPELKPWIGQAEDWEGVNWLFGAVAEGKLVAIGEALVQDRAGYAAIQQVYTLEAWRGKGIGRAAVGRLVERLLAQGKVPVYQVSEENEPSLRLVEGLGFVVSSRWGFLE